MSEVAIAKAVGTSQPTINKIHRGVIKEPGWTLGAALVVLAESPARRRRAAQGEAAQATKDVLNP